MAKQIISIVIPTFNEAGNVELIYKAVVESVPKNYLCEIIFVDDGSNDETLPTIKKLARKHTNVKYLSFTRNFGHQYALKAGIDHASGEAVITLDSDLEHPPKLIPKMIIEWCRGAKIVNTVRKDNPNLALHKRITSLIFYKFINKLSDVPILQGGADFRLIDQSVAKMIKESSESTLFLRGLVAWSGYPSTTLTYAPNKRRWGRSKYTYSKMLRLAVDALTSFSVVPLRIATIIGFLMSFFTGLYGLYAIIAYFTNWNVITGWPSVIISVLFIGGLQLLILGIIGEYIGKIFLETKKRPLYVINESKL
ncbi:MAG: glycosyltransferase [Candidatus Moraniibacteriota bacterium]|nr:MAG: glycosyltransferase [Candidatus Moranbacteria bacterium]